MENINTVELENCTISCVVDNDFYTLSSDIKGVAYGSFSHADASIISFAESSEKKLEIGKLWIDLEPFEDEHLEIAFGFTVKDLTDC